MHPEQIKFIFILIVVYQIKHFLADFVLQRFEFFKGKFRDDWNFILPMTVHASIHAEMTGIIAMIAGADFKKTISLALFDFTIHFLMDRAKAGKKYLGRWKPVSAEEYKTLIQMINKEPGVYPLLGPITENPVKGARRRLAENNLFWDSLGFDQMVHHLTHYVIIWYLVNP